MVNENTPDKIARNSLEPLRASVDGQSAEQVPVRDQIAANKYARASRRTRGLPFRTVKLIPGNNADLNICGENI